MEGSSAKSKFQCVCVFCGSSMGKKEEYKIAALELAEEIVARNIDLVYGGGSIGLMGVIARAVHEGGQQVLGIIPKPLIGKEKTGESIGEVKVVANMHERKAEMARKSECFIALPGGYGTLEEFFEIITAAQLGIHSKPIGLLNVDGYYNNIIALIDSIVEEGFIQPSQRHIFVHATTAKELIQKLEGYKPLQDEVLTKLKAAWASQVPK